MTDKGDTINVNNGKTATGNTGSNGKAAGNDALQSEVASKKESREDAVHELEQEVVAEGDKIAHEIERAASVIAHGDPKTEERIRQFEATSEAVDKNKQSRWYKRYLSTPTSNKKLPIGVKIFGVLCVLGAMYGLYEMVMAIVSTVRLFSAGHMDSLGASTIVVTFIRFGDLVLLALAFGALGVQLFRGKRVFAALLIDAILVLVFAGAICSLMLYGVNLRLVFYGAALAILVAFQVYLDPQLRKERQLQRMLHDNEIKHEQEEGILGRDLTGKGFIKLDFFNLFWIFFICSILGDAIESVFHVLVVDPGHWQDRAGLLFGPFSPIYGCGAVLMTLFLNRLYKRNILLVFLLSAIIGGLFESFVSVFMQYAYGAVAWDYTGQWLSLFGGRTCGLAMCAWGLLGVVWLKLLLPLMLWLIDKIPWKWRYSVTGVATAFMAVDCVMSLQALDCWYERLAGDPINTPIKDFYAHWFDNTFMEDRFQSMTINPDNAVRGGK